jgi:hypothetical protein
VWRAGIPTGFAFATTECATSDGSRGDPYYFYAGTGTDGALELSNGGDLAAGLSLELTSLTSLSGFQPTVATGVGYPLRVEVSIPSRGIAGSALVAGGYLHHWSTTDVFSDVFLEWSDGHGGETSSTLADYVVSHADDAAYPASVRLIGGCAPDNARGYELRELRVAVDGTQRILDFQAPIRPATGDREQTIRYGDRVTLRASAEQDPVAGTPLQLWSRPTGSTEARLVASATTAADGVASVTVRPIRTTRYWWRYDVPHDSPATTSESGVLVRVSAQVSLSLAAPVIAQGRRGVAVVSVSPCRGQRVLLRHQSELMRRLPRARPDGCRTRLPFVLAKAGPSTLVAIVRSRPGLAGASSRPVHIQVRPANHSD